MINGNTVGGITGYGKTFVLTDESGNELTGVVVGEEVLFTADPVKDIREGKVAATDAGVVTGSKEIPSYHTSAGSKLITDGSALRVPMPNYEYTQLQCIICDYNTNLQNSVSAQQVVINDYVYNVQSTAVVSTVTKEVASGNGAISLGITNTSGHPMLIRYFSYKEID